MGTYIIGALVFGLIGYIIFSLYKRRKNGGACGGGCPGCSHASQCGQKTE